MPQTGNHGLTAAQVQSFIDDGFVKVENAFSTELAEQCRDELWAEIGLSPDRPDGWTRPVVRVASKATRPFIAAANTPRLHSAYDRLVGKGRWIAPQGLGPSQSASPRQRRLATTAGMWT